MRAVGLPADQPDANLAPFYLGDDPHAVTYRGTDPDVRVLLAEKRQQGWQQVFARDRTRGKRQIAADRGVVSGNLPTRLLVQVEYPLGEIVELPARVGEQHPTALPPEQECAERLFDDLHALADRRLGQAQQLRRPGEAAQLGGL